VVRRRRPRWLLVTIAALGLLHLLSSIPFLASNLAHPESPVSFLTDAAAAIAVLTAALAAVAGLRGVRNRRPLAVGAGVLMALLVVVSLVATGSVTSDPRQPGDVVVEVVGATFPAEVAVTAHGAALWIDNQDPFRHTLVVEGTDVHVELTGSTAVRAEVDLAPGAYRYYCDVPGHDRMEGSLDVR
jgi:plastocyanin